MVPSSWLKIVVLYILPILELSVGSVLMCIASLASLDTCLLSLSMILNGEISALGGEQLHRNNYPD